MSNYDKLWQDWYNKKVLTEMRAGTANKVVKVSDSIKQKAGLEALNDSYTRMAAFPEIFGDKLRIVVDTEDDELLVMAKYVGELKALASQSLKDKVAKGFIKDIPMTYYADLVHDQLYSKEIRRRLQEDGGGTYEVEVAYYQPILRIEYINMQNQLKKENLSLLKAFNKFKMKEAADYWANIQSRYTKDKEFIVSLVNDYSGLNIQRKAESGKAIVYSRAPIDVLRMSDHPMISSCHSQGNSYFHCAIQEAVRGGAIAYSVNKEDIQRITDEGRLQDIEIFQDPERNIEGIVPDGRVRIRRMFDTDTKEEYALPEMRVYGRPPSSFANNVLKWAAENQKSKFTNLETNEFQLPTIKNAIKVGGSYDDNYSSELYARLAKKVANLFGLNDIKLEYFNISSVSVNEGMDLMSDCERQSKVILNEIGIGDPANLISIENYKVICKSNGKMGIAATRKYPLFDEQPGNEDFNDEFVGVEVDYAYSIWDYMIKGTFKTQLTSDIIKQLILKTEELAPDGTLYLTYKLFGLEDIQFIKEKLSGNFVYKAIKTLAFKTVEEIDTLKFDIPQDLQAYRDYDYSYQFVLEEAAIKLDIIEPQPFRSNYAKTLYRDINSTDYMTYFDTTSYNGGGLVSFYSPNAASQFQRTDGIRGNLKQTTMFSSTTYTNQFLQSLSNYFYVYTIPKQALRTILKFATSKSHPDARIRRSITLKNDDIIKQIRIKIQQICILLVEKFKKKMGDTNITDYVRFDYYVSTPIIILDKNSDQPYLDKDLQIAFGLNIDLSRNLSIEEQELLLELVEYLYRNFYKFRDNLEKELIDDLKESDNTYIKNLMTHGYVKGIEGEEPIANSIDINEEDMPQILQQMFKLVVEKSKQKWHSLNGKKSVGKAPFFAAFVNNKAIRVYYATTRQSVKTNPLKEQIYYIDYELELYKSSHHQYSAEIIIKCPMVDKGAVGSVSFNDKNMQELVEDLAVIAVNNIWYSQYAIKTTLEDQKEYLSDNDTLFNTETDQETPQEPQPTQPPKVQKQITGLSGEVGSKEDPRQMKMFERNINKKLIKERLITWYKRNKK